MPSEIPQELIDLIIDQVSLLDEHSAVGLRSCLFVSTSFCRKARSLLFCNVKFRNNQPIETLQALSTFLDLLLSSSDHRNTNVTPFTALGGPIAPLVKTFHLPIMNCASAREAVLIFDTPIFISVLRCLTGNAFGPSKVKFDINTTFPHSPNKLNWELLSTRSQDAFRVLFQSAHLEAIHLYGFENLPSNFLDGCHIRHLEILYSHCSVPTTASKAVSSNLLRLESVCTDQTICLDLLTLNGNSIISNLKSLSICPRWPQTTFNDNTWQLLDTASTSLTRLCLQFNATFVFNKHLKLSNLIALEELAIQINQAEDYRCPSHSPCDKNIIELCVLLCDPSPRCPLHTISISIKMTERFPQPDFFDPGPTSNWILLDKALSNTNFLFLRKVSVHLTLSIICDYNSPFEKREFREQVKTSLKHVFPTISESTSIEFVVEVDTVMKIHPRSLPSNVVANEWEIY